jgi:hypothetical protein
MLVLEASLVFFEHTVLFGKCGEEWRILSEKDIDF